VLNGIGGRSIAEAMRTLSYAEVLSWMAYRKKRGSLNLGLRGDRQVALPARLFLQWCGVKHIGEFDLLPYEQAPAPVMPDLTQAMKSPEWS